MITVCRLMLMGWSRRGIICKLGEPHKDRNGRVKYCDGYVCGQMCTNIVLSHCQ